MSSSSRPPASGTGVLATNAETKRSAAARSPRASRWGLAEPRAERVVRGQCESTHRHLGAQSSRPRGPSREPLAAAAAWRAAGRAVRGGLDDVRAEVLARRAVRAEHEIDGSSRPSGCASTLARGGRPRPAAGVVLVVVVRLELVVEELRAPRHIASTVSSETRTDARDVRLLALVVDEAERRVRRGRRAHVRRAARARRR